MKHLFLTIFLSVSLVALFGCSQSNQVSGPSSNGYSYSVKAVDESGSVVKTSVLAIVDGGEQIFADCDNNGTVLIKSDKAVKEVYLVSLGKSGKMIDPSSGESCMVTLSSVPQKSGLEKTASIGTFGVYATDSKGDVTFKYKGAFIGYYCINYLPPLPSDDGVSNNPNTWNGCVINDWLPTWKGKKLLVPRTYRWYHSGVYGYSISNALMLMSAF